MGAPNGYTEIAGKSRNACEMGKGEEAGGACKSGTPKLYMQVRGSQRSPTILAFASFFCSR